MTSTTDRAPLRLAIVNDYTLVIAGLSRMLEPYADRIEVVELNANTTPDQSVDVALYDTFSAPQVTDVDVDRLLANPNVDAVVIYTWNLHPALRETSTTKGVRGYLSKSLAGEALVGALERVVRGEVVVEPAEDFDLNPAQIDAAGVDWPGRLEGLTQRQSEVVALITQGLSNQEIAQRTMLSLNTIKSYIRQAYRTMGVETRAQAVAWGFQHDMAPDHARIS